MIQSLTPRSLHVVPFILGFVVAAPAARSDLMPTYLAELGGVGVDLFAPDGTVLHDGYGGVGTATVSYGGASVTSIMNYELEYSPTRIAFAIDGQSSIESPGSSTDPWTFYWITLAETYYDFTLTEPQTVQISGTKSRGYLKTMTPVDFV